MASNKDAIITSVQTEQPAFWCKAHHVGADAAFRAKLCLKACLGTETSPAISEYKLLNLQDSRSAVLRSMRLKSYKFSQGPLERALWAN